MKAILLNVKTHLINGVKLFFRAVHLLLSISYWQSFLLIVAILVQGIMPAITIKLVASLIDTIALGKESFDTQHTLWILSLGWAATLLVRECVNPLVLFFQGNLADQAVFFINKSIMHKANAIEGLQTFEDEQFHNDVQLLQSQSYHKPLNLVVTLVGLARDFVFIVSCLVLLCEEAAWIGFVALICAFIHFKVFARVQKLTWQESLGRSPRSRRMNYLSSLTMNAACAKELRFFELGHYLLKEYTYLCKEVYHHIFHLRLKQLLWPLLPILFSVGGNLLAFLTIVEMAFNGTAGVGAVVLLLQALSQLHLSVSSFGEQAGWVSGHLLFFEKYFYFLKVKEKVFIDNQFQKKDLITDPIQIDFQNVSFDYPDGRAALRNLHFSLYPGEKLAIVGANGSGKSTLIKLLCGFYAPTEGKILVNHFPLEEVDLNEWRKRISPVFQDFSEYALSFQDNISMGAPVSDKEKLNSVIKQCQLDNLLSELPEGFEQLLGKAFGGTELSGGQWQRIAIARAAYKDAPIFILDEPTAALDPISEYELFHQIAKIFSERTMILVTHRLSSVLMADRILLLDKGRLLDQGTHSELMQRSILYRCMFEMQASAYLKLQQSSSIASSV